MKKVTELDNLHENESYATPAEAVKESAKAGMDAGELIDDWVDTYLKQNGIDKVQYAHEAGTSIQTVLNKYGYEIVKKK